MDVSRAFLIMGSIWILIGLALGLYMGGAEDFALTAVHAHINLVGFVLSSIFGLVYLVKPAMAQTRLATVHFWLHLVGGLILLPFLFLDKAGLMSEESAGPIMGIGGGPVLLGLVIYLVNLVRNG